MKHTNEASYRTALSYGCKEIDEFEDEVNGLMRVLAITRQEWESIYYKK